LPFTVGIRANSGYRLDNWLKQQKKFHGCFSVSLWLNKMFSFLSVLFQAYFSCADRLRTCAVSSLCVASFFFGRPHCPSRQQQSCLIPPKRFACFVL